MKDKKKLKLKEIKIGEFKKVEERAEFYNPFTSMSHFKDVLAPKEVSSLEEFSKEQLPPEKWINL